MEIKLKIILIPVCRHWDSRTPMLEAQLRWVWSFSRKDPSLLSGILTISKGHSDITLTLSFLQTPNYKESLRQSTWQPLSGPPWHSRNLNESPRHHSNALRPSVAFSQSHNLWEGASFKTGMTWRQSGSMCILGFQFFVEYLFDFHVYSRF